jgi:uncharacterized protein (UPF0548 family)
MFLLQTYGVASRTGLASQRAQAFFYPDVGATRHELPAGYTVLRGRVNPGEGSATSDRAVQALRRWKMFDVPGSQFYWPGTPFIPGKTVAIVIRHFGFWSLN